jgi:hypothetical protein
MLILLGAWPEVSRPSGVIERGKRVKMNKRRVVYNASFDRKRRLMQEVY